MLSGKNTALLRNFGQGCAEYLDETAAMQLIDTSTRRSAVAPGTTATPAHLPFLKNSFAARNRCTKPSFPEWHSAPLRRSLPDEEQVLPAEHPAQQGLLCLRRDSRREDASQSALAVLVQGVGDGHGL